MQDFNTWLQEENRCWKGYEPTPGVKKYEKGSCRKKKLKETSFIEWAKDQKPYKNFNKDKNHPEGGLSRKEAKKQGIHAGIETKEEAEKKGGFDKLSDETQLRRKSFCARMCKAGTAKSRKDPKSKQRAALKVWGCRC